MDIKETFCNNLNTEYESIPRYDLKIVKGDTNAKLGKEEMHRDITGKHSLHERTTEIGMLLVDFARENNMVIKSTQFKSYDNQIDHVLVEKKQERVIKNVRSYRGLDADTDHYMVGVMVQLEIPKIKNGKNKKYEHKTRLRKEHDKTK